MKTIIIIFEFAWISILAWGVFLAGYSIYKVDEMAKRKNYTKEQRKKYLILWIILLIFTIYVLIDEIFNLKEILQRLML